jgi:hypothetical protein
MQTATPPTLSVFFSTVILICHRSLPEHVFKHAADRFGPNAGSGKEGAGAFPAPKGVDSVA